MLRDELGLGGSFPLRIQQLSQPADRAQPAAGLGDRQLQADLELRLGIVKLAAPIGTFILIRFIVGLFGPGDRQEIIASMREQHGAVVVYRTLALDALDDQRFRFYCGFGGHGSGRLDRGIVAVERLQWWTKCD